MVQYLPYLISVASLLFTAFSYFRRESREDSSAAREVTEKRLANIEGKHATVAAEVANQHNTMHELQREHDRVAALHEGQISQVKKELHLLEPVPGRVSNLEAKFDTLNERISNLKEGVGELKEGQKENKREILEAIRQMKD